MRYWAPFNGDSQDIDSNDGYQDANPITGLQGSVPTFRPFEQMQRELVNLVTKSGLTPDATINGIQVAQAIQSGKINAGLDASGVANNYVVSLDPVPASYTTGMLVWLFALAGNSGPCTINVNGLGVKQVTRQDASACMGGDIVGGYAGSGLLYNGTEFVLVTSSPQQIRQLAFARNRVIFATPGAFTWTVPANVYFIQVKGWGGGGGGGGAAAGSPGGAASGGGSGGYVAVAVPVVAGQVITGFVGGGGGQGTVGSNGGGGGTSSIVIAGVPYTATGGAGGLSANAQVQQNSISGGTYTNGDTTSHIGAVSAGGYFSHNGTLSIAEGGFGGNAPYGGYGGNAGAGNGNSGSAPGGGGGGAGGYAGSVAVGGGGAAGQVWFEY